MAEAELTVIYANDRRGDPCIHILADHGRFVLTVYQTPTEVGEARKFALGVLTKAAEVLKPAHT